MGRYTGPRVKKMRALGVELPGLSRKTIEKRPYPPGEHGRTGRRRLSDYSVRLQEKQKLRYNYGISESQLRRYYQKAHRSNDPTGDKLVELIERRLDNVVFRANFAPTIPAARQLVTHKHVLVNGKSVWSPAYTVNEGDTIEIRERSRDMIAIRHSLEFPAIVRPDWLNLDEDALKAEIVGLPRRDSVPFPFQPELVVEYYAGR